MTTEAMRAELADCHARNHWLTANEKSLRADLAQLQQLELMWTRMLAIWGNGNDEEAIIQEVRAMMPPKGA